MGPPGLPGKDGEDVSLWCNWFQPYSTKRFAHLCKNCFISLRKHRKIYLKLPSSVLFQKFSEWYHVTCFVANA